MNVSRLEWRFPDDLPTDRRDALIGPGAPFELVTDTARGFRQLTFVTRPKSLRAGFERTVARKPDNIYLSAESRALTFAETIGEVEAISRVLVESYRIKPGDRVAIVAANSAEYVLTMMAVVSTGAIISSLNGWWTGPELEHGITLTEPSLILGDPPRLARLSDITLPPGVPVRTLEEIHAEAQALGAGDRSWASPTIDEDDPAIILFTSGTTGFAKGATLSHRNIIHFALSSLLLGAIGALRGGGNTPTNLVTGPNAPQPATILQSPLFHVSGLVGVFMTGGIIGSKLVIPPPGRWDPVTHIRLTVAHGVTSWSGVPTQFFRLLHEPSIADVDLTTVTNIGGGGAPFPPDLTREIHERLPWMVLGNGYGMSESSGMGTRINGAAMVANPDSVGPPNPTVEVEIRDESGAIVPENEVGEIYLRTAAIFLGYWNNPKATAESIDGDGWYRTGDFGRIANGMLYLESRIRDLILRGGENIYPMEVEHRLVEHPDVVDAAVIGVDHPEYGQEVKAFVVLREGASLTASELQQFVAKRLAGFKVPAYVEFRTSLPYTETGKVIKHQLETEERADKTVPS